MEAEFNPTKTLLFVQASFSCCCFLRVQTNQSLGCICCIIDCFKDLTSIRFIRCSFSHPSGAAWRHYRFKEAASSAPCPSTFSRADASLDLSQANTWLTAPSLALLVPFVTSHWGCFFFCWCCSTHDQNSETRERSRGWTFLFSEIGRVLHNMGAFAFTQASK